ncbi:transcription termination/antitermination protein NusG [Limibacter armeniacum]|uniref:transcription termination/antitermination protein NusG n=1 Tax=Limibacter armeniacum TaxID=466084 RepID=UPI002FE69BCF
MSGLNWYVVRAVSGQEKKVKEYLVKEVENQGMGAFITDVFVPTERVYQTRKQRDGKTKKVEVERISLPGYVIVRADLSNGEALHMIKNVSGVIGFLNADTKDPSVLPKPMRESEINRLLNINEQDEEEVKHDVSFVVGESVKVMDGPFSGFTGTVEEVHDEKKKLNVMVKIFGRNAPVELDYKQVEKVD